MENLPLYINFLMVMITLVTVFIFYRATHHNRTFLLVVSGWLIVQSAVSLTGFYQNTSSIPPRFPLLIGPPLVCNGFLLFTEKGRQFIDNLDLKQLTLLHSIRIVVELVLLQLYLFKTVPQVMTFEGKNFDILSGITAPAIYYFVFVKRTVSTKLLLLWNVICVGLLLWIVGIAVLSAPLPIQKIAFDQPNIAVLYYPFTWLPCCVVPLVLLSHLAAIRQLLQAQKKDVTVLNLSKSI